MKLLQSVRTSKILSQTTLNAQQKLLVKFQRSNLVETTDDEDTGGEMNTIKELNHPNPLVRVFALGKIN